MLIRVFDIGSNSIKASVFRRGTDAAELVSKSKLEFALGDAVFTHGSIPESGVDQVASFILRQTSQQSEEPVQCTLAVATSAIRSALNRDAVIQTLNDRTQLPIRVLSGWEESYLIHLGIVTRAKVEKNAWVKSIDIGGGSAEISISQGQEYHYGHSFDLGAIRLAHRFLDDRPIKAEQIQALRQAVAMQLDQTPMPRQWPTTVAMGSSGNVKAVGTMMRSFHGLKNATTSPTVTLETVDDLLRETVGTTPSQIQARFGLTPDRSRIIIAALVVLHSLMLRLNIRELAITESGLREGVADFWSRHGHLQLPRDGSPSKPE